MNPRTEQDVAAGEAKSNGTGTERETSFPVIDPTTGGEIARVHEDSPEEVAEAVARVRSNQAEWEALGIPGRRKWLNQLRDWLLDNSELIADSMQAETGKVRADASNEGFYVADQINFYGSRAGRWIGEEKVRPHSLVTFSRKLRVRYTPYPVVGLISPWNFPLILSLGDAIPALVAGASVVMKPSEFTPLTLGMIVDAWQDEIGGPDVIAVVNGTAEPAGALIDEADFIGFTGSDRTGRIVMKRAADTLTPVSLELGGKDPMIVLEGADLDRAAEAAAWGGMMNSGQICMSVERIYVEHAIYEPFVEKLVERVDELKQGPDGSDYGSDVGAMTSPNQTGIVEGQVDEAVRDGAKTLTGGSRREGEGDYYEPTVLVEVDHSMRVMRDETFGPVVGVMPVANEEEAVRLANDTRYGLSATVFGPRRKAEAVARRIECGAVNVNDVLFNALTPGIPMGGWKESGIGWRNGGAGIRKYCRSEAIVTARFPDLPEPFWYPYTPERRAVINRITRLVTARGVRDRLGL